mmetsp:Transcript_7651/g.19063  ORF Transcript_7651/g.19063 Transcript_7651/m.19063 type:complete len:327 (-) Transcript_7651:22-1002(-)
MDRLQDRLDGGVGNGLCLSQKGLDILVAGGKVPFPVAVLPLALVVLRYLEGVVPSEGIGDDLVEQVKARARCVMAVAQVGPAGFLLDGQGSLLGLADESVAVGGLVCRILVDGIEPTVANEGAAQGHRHPVALLQCPGIGILFANVVHHRGDVVPRVRLPAEIKGSLQGSQILDLAPIILVGPGTNVEVGTVELHEFGEKVVKVLVDPLVVVGIVPAGGKGQPRADGLVDVQDVGGSVVPRMRIDPNVIPVVPVRPVSGIQPKGPILQPQSVHARAGGSAVEPDQERNVGLVLVDSSVCLGGLELLGIGGKQPIKKITVALVVDRE